MLSYKVKLIISKGVLLLKYIYTIFFSLITLFLVSCDSSKYIAGNGVDIDGVVVDGYVRDAEVCLDYNSNTLCDSNEPRAITDKNGKFYFKNTNIQENSLTSILATNGIDTLTDRELTWQFKNIIQFSNTAESNSSLVISPITDLIATSFLAADTQSNFILDNAKREVAQITSLDINLLNTNPMKNKTLYAKSQDILHTQLLLESIGLKTLNYSYTKEKQLKLQNDIKKSILLNNANINMVLIDIENKLDVTMPNNQKTFVINQIAEFHNELNNFAINSTLGIDSFSAIQHSLEKAQEEADALIKSADENSTLAVINIDLSVAAINKSIFDTSGATLDDQSCLKANGYMELEHNSFMVEEAKDEDNGISIKSSYEFGDKSRIQIYYPTLTSAKTNDVTTIFFSEENYSFFTFDGAWLQNQNKTIYVMTPMATNGLYTCYRYKLDSTNSENLTRIKVFRYAK